MSLTSDLIGLSRRTTGLNLALLACAGLLAQWPATAQVRLTEFSAANSTGLTDEDGQIEDWIEVANLGDTPVDLLGWHLTDDQIGRSSCRERV